MKRINIVVIFLSVVVTLLSGCSNWHVRSKRRPSRLLNKDSYVELPIKAVKDTTLDEAIICKDYYKKVQDIDLASKYLEHALTLAKDHMLRSSLILELGDMYMKIDNKDKAGKMYNQYKLLYPGSPQINYVLYQEILASYEDAGESTKDATKNKETVKLAEQYVKEFGYDQDHGERIKKMLDDSYIKLLKKEVEAAEFYLNKYNYEQSESALKSAQKRIEFALKEYAEHVPDHDALMALKDTAMITQPVEAVVVNITSVLTAMKAYVTQHYTQPRHKREHVFASSVSIDESEPQF